MTTTQEAPMNNLLTCAHLFIDLQAIEPLLADARRVFITRDNHSTIRFRITDKSGDHIHFYRTYNWKNYNTPSAVRDAVSAVYQDLIAANLIRRDSEPNS